ncbi:hypothetical protein BC936DRAFT_142597 [Jimgerdemannia flammicorona]|uniref:Uncharacterized protein n=1 Tax=Jimgerdemannia flammicorona TaxID=994334 RepID=A0A433DF18_9FUNG|nr:hypothetical protein BC936DRAFT_142597 [Jimgerdemannia flammicorona]
MSAKKPSTTVTTTDLETLKTQLDVSVGIARSLVASWLPPPKPGEEDEGASTGGGTTASYAEGRPPRLGLGAKYLSHADATRHLAGGSATMENKLKRKILGGNQRAQAGRDDATDNLERNGSRAQAEKVEEEDSRNAVVGKKRKAVGNGMRAVDHEEGEKKPVGDFLSMYLDERAEKKKKRKKKKKRNGGGGTGEGEGKDRG